MTEEERRYKILKKESYEKKAKYEKDNMVSQAMITGVLGVAAVLELSGTMGVDFPNMIAGLTTGIGSSIWLANTIRSICGLTMYESKIEDINAELEMLEQNEKGGMKR